VNKITKIGLIPFVLVVLGVAAAGASHGQTAAPAPTPPPIRLSLTDAVTQALSDATQEHLATLSVSLAQTRADLALAALRPQANAELRVASDMVNLKTFGFAAPGFPTVVGPFDVVDAHVTAAWDVINFAAKRRYEAARAGVRISEAERRRIENEVAAAVASLYVSVERSRTRIDEIRSNVTLFDKLRQLAFDQQKAGVGTRIDTTRADVQLARQRQALLVAENQRDLAQLALLRAVGGDLGTTDVVLTDDLTKPQEDRPTVQSALLAARQLRPELHTLAAQMRAAELAEKAVRAEKLPHLTLSATGTESGNYVRDLFWTRSLNAVASVPIFTGKRLEQQIVEAQIQRQQLTEQQRDLERQIEQEVRQALLRYDNARSRVELAEQNIKLADDELEIARDRFQSGVATSIEVDNAQTAVAEARDSRVDALADQAQARFDLARATGEIRNLIPGQTGPL
jgi:outer membrane protein TolC